MLRLKWTLLVVMLFCGVAKSQIPQEERKANRPLKSNVKVVNTTLINSPGTDFSPVIYQNGVVFASSRHNSGPIDKELGEAYFELYYAEANGYGLPLKPESFSLELNSPMHEGSVAFNDEGNIIWFTRNNSENGYKKVNKKNDAVLKIYMAKRGVFDWEDIREMSFNSENYSCMHPTLDPMGERLFFASDMPGGHGGFDIFFVIRQGNRWSKPINLGPEVNTEKDELFPFYHKSGTLFFSSEGHDSKGGLDLFFIDISSNKWGKVTNLEYPFNTEKDDLSIVLNENGTRGYFASDRSGGMGKDDIYLFEAPEGIEGMKKPEKINLNIAVRDMESGNKLKGVGIRFYPLESDGYINNEALYDVHLVPSGEHPSKLVPELRLKTEGELGPPDVFTDINGKAKFEALEADRKFFLLVSKAGYTTKEIEYNTTEKEEEDLLEIQLEPSRCITLKGTVKSDKYFRAIPNALVTVISSCGEKQEMLRTNVDGQFEVCLLKGCNFAISTEKDGFKKSETNIETGNLDAGRTAVVELLMEAYADSIENAPIRKGTVMLLENIYYDFNKSAIRKGAARELEALSQLMSKYPSMEIELSAHTDSRGDEGYNLKLSLKRAESAKRFLVRRGIDSERITVFGYGESRLRNQCSDGIGCTEDEHEYNRRTEVKITRIDESVVHDRTEEGLRIIEGRQ